MDSGRASGISSLMVAGPFLVDRLRYEDGAEPRELPGGNGLVVAATVAGLGWPVVLAGQLAEDELGERLARYLEARGVRLLRQEAPSGAESKRAEILVSADGQWRTLGTHPQRYPYIGGPVPLDGYSALLLTGLCSLWRSCPGPVEAWLAEARRAGVPVALGLNKLSSGEATVVRRLLGARDTLFCNREEACAWLGVGAEGLVRALAGAPGGDLVVSLGAEGVLVRPEDSAVVHLPAESVQVVSTIGAGDVLCAVTVARRLEGVPLLEAAAAGQRAATASVRSERWDRWMVP